MGKRCPYTEKQIDAFRKNIKELRSDNELSNGDIGELTGFSKNYVAQIICGASNPSETFVASVSKAFGIASKDLLRPLIEMHTETWSTFGREVSLARDQVGFSRKQMADFLGIPMRVYVEIEEGKCSTSELQKDTIRKLLRMNETSETQPEAKKKVPKEAVSFEELPDDILEVLLKHVKDLKTDLETQRKVFRSLSGISLAREERKLFG